LETALENSIEEWRRVLKQSAPGRRFRDHYSRRQQAGHDRSTLRRVCYVAFGVAIAIGSLVLAPLPGPGWSTFFVGLGIVAGEVSHVARLLDRAEVKLREMLRRAKGVWGKSAIAVRVLIALTIFLCLVASVWGVYDAFSGVLESAKDPSGMAAGQLVDLPQ
jgi:uncharacterized protein (TIGR02611 family)